MLKTLAIYIAGSFKHLHGVRMLGRQFRKMGCVLLDWTDLAAPPQGLTPMERRIWMDTDRAGGDVYKFCRDACLNADLVLYYGASGQDAGVEVGIAAAAGTPVLGLRGPLEGPGLMLHGAVDVWVDSAEEAITIVNALMRGHADANVWPLLDKMEARTRKMGLTQRHHPDNLEAKSDNYKDELTRGE